MSNTNCHFDGDRCAKKQARFDAWQRVVLQTDGIVFQINPGMFSECPIENDNERQTACERYRRYLFVIEQANSANER